MPIPQNTQHLIDKEHKYFGSDRAFFVGSVIGSTTAWSNLTFSGTATGFGAQSVAGQDMSQRFAIVGSGGNTVPVQWSWDSGTTIHGEVWPSEALTFDGKARQGIAIRTSAASQQVRIWVW